MDQHQISDYIENLPLQTAFCKGYRPDEVYEAICNLSSMYNQVLSEAYTENEELKQKIECLEKTKINSQSSLFNGQYSRTTTVEEPLMGTDTLSEQKQRDAMTDKELQRLKRGELLEILLEQSKENEKLKLQLEERDKAIEDLNQKIADKKIALQEAGTIAEASFKLNGVFDAAEKAAQQYLDNLQELHQKEQEEFAKKESDTELKCAAMMQATKERCEFMKEEAARECADLEQNMMEKCRNMELEVTSKCQKLDAETTSKCKQMETEVTNRCKALEAETTSKCRQMENEVTNRCRAMETEVTNKCQTMEAEAIRKSEELSSLTEHKCRQRELEAEEKCAELDRKAKENVDKRWSELSTKLEDFYTTHQGIRELLAMSKM